VPATRNAGIIEESQEWIAFGAWLADQREQKGFSCAEAARRAQVAEADWLELEVGRRAPVSGIRVLPHPSRELLERVADVLEVPVGEVLARVSRHDEALRRAASSAASSEASAHLQHPAEGSALLRKLHRLSERDQLVVERLIDVLLEADRRGEQR
jgi:transcriptional regulator with XRE-family HTH domain